MPADHGSAPPDDGSTSALVVQLAGTRCALPASAVEEILPAARVQPVAAATDRVLGLLSVRGEPVVVIDGAACMGRVGTPLDPAERFVVLADTEPKTAVRVDAACDVIDLPMRRLGGEAVTEGLASLGVAVLDDGLVVIHDPVTFVAAADHEALRRAVDELRGA